MSTPTNLTDKVTFIRWRDPRVDPPPENIRILIYTARAGVFASTGKALRRNVISIEAWAEFPSLLDTVTVEQVREVGQFVKDYSVPDTDKVKDLRATIKTIIKGLKTSL